MIRIKRSLTTLPMICSSMPRCCHRNNCSKRGRFRAEVFRDMRPAAYDGYLTQTKTGLQVLFACPLRTTRRLRVCGNS